MQIWKLRKLGSWEQLLPESPLDALLLVGAAPQRDVHAGEDLEDLAGDERQREHDQDVRDVTLLLSEQSFHPMRQLTHISSQNAICNLQYLFVLHHLSFIMDRVTRVFGKSFAIKLESSDYPNGLLR